MTRRVPYSVDQMYAIAADVASYKEFLPLVDKSVVRNRRKVTDHKEQFDADLEVYHDKLRIAETLTSHVTTDAAHHLVRAESHQGPVKSLVSEWRITPASGGGSEIHFSVNYTLKSRTLQFLVSGMFDYLVRKIMSAFEERAKLLYGRPSSIASS